MNTNDNIINNKIINSITKNIGISQKKVYDFLYLIKTGKALDNTALVRALGVSKNVLNQTKKELNNILEAPSTFTQLRDSMIPALNSLFSPDYKTEDNLFKLFEDNYFEKAKELLNKYENTRPSPDRSYDQFNATIETTAKRASLLNFFSDIENKRLLFLGDDDFTSVAVSSIRKEAKVSVLDIDDRLLKGIESIALKEHFDIKTQVHDFRKALPPSYLGKYDIVFTDPPYTPEGIKLFLSRAIQSLDPTCLIARIYLCYGNSDRAKERFLPIYDLINESGLMIRYVLDKFNRYHGAESIGSSSTLFILEVTPKTKPLTIGNYAKAIYTNN